MQDESVRRERESIDLTATVVTAYLSSNSIDISALPSLISTVHAAIESLGKPATVPAKLSPPVPIKKSVTPEFIISFEDGRPYKSLKRHLAKHGLTPAEYRVKWGLPDSYPMIAANYAARRSEIARSTGLGRKRAKKAKTGAPTKAGRRAKAA